LAIHCPTVHVDHDTRPGVDEASGAEGAVKPQAARDQELRQELHGSLHGRFAFAESVMLRCTEDTRRRLK